VAQPVFAFAECGDPTTDGRHMLAEVEVEALDEGGIDLPAAGHQHLLDRLQRAERHAVCHPDQTPPSDGLHHLCIERLCRKLPKTGKLTLASH
jgi:hypothetical protein